jgi:hypothetical protein
LLDVGLEPYSDYEVYVFPLFDGGYTTGGTDFCVITTDGPFSRDIAAGQTGTTSRLMAYPVPFTHQVSVIVPEGAVNAELYDMTGRLVERTDKVVAGQAIQMGANLARGTYILRSGGQQMRVIKAE